MGQIDNVLFHVRAAPPSKNRTLRFRNKFQHKSCLFASASRQESIEDWFSRYITATYPIVKSITWGIDTVHITVSDSDAVDIDWLELLRAKTTYVYQYTLDMRWNRHPTKNCYMTRSNVKYRVNPSPITFTDVIQGRHLDIKLGVTHVKSSTQ